MSKIKILFIHDSKYEVKDGLWAALNLLEKDGFSVHKINLNDWGEIPFTGYAADQGPSSFVLGWGAFGSKVDKFIQERVLRFNEYEREGLLNSLERGRCGLCIAGNSFPPDSQNNYDVLFHETEWYLPQIMSHKNAVHAFGINSDIYKPIEDAVPIWDWITVGAFADWKRQAMLLDKGGYKLAIGEIQKENIKESMSIITTLMSEGVAISDMVEPEVLAKIYNSAEKVYIPASIHGGGERAVLEARACGRPVEVEFDNPKLKELLTCPVWDQYYYFDQLKKGIQSCF